MLLDTGAVSGSRKRRRDVTKQLALMAAVAPLLALNLAAQQPAPAAAPSLAQRIAHTNPASFRASKSVHGGAGQLDFAPMLSTNAFDTNMHFVHRGVLQPGG